jgi:hypothetical protein
VSWEGSIATKDDAPLRSMTVQAFVSDSHEGILEQAVAALKRDPRDHDAIYLPCIENNEPEAGRSYFLTKIGDVIVAGRNFSVRPKVFR